MTVSEITPLAVPEPVPVAEIASCYERLSEQVGRVVVGQQQAVRLCFVTLLCSGHSLLEGVPGVAKTLLVKTLARALDVRFGRVQFTPDLLPSDIVGTPVLQAASGEVRFRAGPLFTDLLLADEINRASPKTQSGLLECMQERSVSADGETHELARPFIVLATQNPAEYEGTYPLPEAQLDRFMVSLSLGYPAETAEVEMLDVHGMRDFVLELAPVTDVAEVLAAQRLVRSVHGSEALRRYVVSVAAATRDHPEVDVGASPRASLMLFRAAKALAALRGRDHALPDDVQELAPTVIAHRLILGPGADDADRARVVGEAVEKLPAL